MIQDTSENFQETKSFLDNRLNDLENFNRLKNEVKSFYLFYFLFWAGVGI
jgi:ubiquinone biosynthesis protein COQ9